VRIPVAGERVQSEFNPAAAEGVTHPESLRQKDRNTKAISLVTLWRAQFAELPPKGQRPTLAVISQVPRTEG